MKIESNRFWPKNLTAQIGHQMMKISFVSAAKCKKRNFSVFPAEARLGEFGSVSMKGHVEPSPEQTQLKVTILRKVSLLWFSVPFGLWFHLVGVGTTLLNRLQSHLKAQLSGPYRNSVRKAERARAERPQESLQNPDKSCKATGMNCFTGFL